MFVFIAVLLYLTYLVSYAVAVTLLKGYKWLMDFIVRKTRYIFLDLNDTP